MGVIACWSISPQRLETLDNRAGYMPISPDMNIPRIEFIGIIGLPEVEPGARLGELIAAACRSQDTPLQAGDVLVVTQKAVSKAEGRLVDLRGVAPSPFARQLAAPSGRDPRVIEVVLRESRAIVRSDPDRGILITETRHGFICANAGVDSSNIPGDEVVSLLPEDPDRSARTIRAEIMDAAGLDLPVIVSDTFGRPWREGQVNFAIGASGISPLRDYRGEADAVGKVMGVTNIAEADEIAAAAELVMGKVIGAPAAVVRGHAYLRGEQGRRALLRDRSMDLFR